MATNELKTSKVRRLRGSASIREDGTFDFRPDGQGASKQEDIKTVRKSRSYRTSGEKQQLILQWRRTRKTLRMRCTGTFARLRRIWEASSAYPCLRVRCWRRTTTSA